MVTLYQDAKRRGIYLALEPTLRAIVSDIFSTDKPNFLFLGICWCSYFIYRYDFIFRIGHETRSHFESRPEMVNIQGYSEIPSYGSQSQSAKIAIH